MNIDDDAARDILAWKLTERPEDGETTHISKLVWRWGVDELFRLLPKGWEIASSTGVGWWLKYNKPT